ncbi:unnamed protein product [Acanthoscelides obtectus]|uniref:Uncharacterized protein n=1 Tax=Acanthoscelides obtectus TaxID=200917 RepID=A0A9P0KDS2_ACAOB|nr:unnamed protein product [Acanthoscelides obtectus]CAK1640960.1 hypothetical protein AOBTE_LOCUS12042 [Acanthoscelides obtectus]
MKAGMSSHRAEILFKISRRTVINKLNKKHKGDDVGRPKMLSEVEEQHLVDVLIVGAEFGSLMTKLDLRMLGTRSVYFLEVQKDT